MLIAISEIIYLISMRFSLTLTLISDEQSLRKRTKVMKTPKYIASVRDSFLLTQTLFRRSERWKGKTQVLWTLCPKFVTIQRLTS